MIKLVRSATPIISALKDAETVVIDCETAGLYPHRDGKILAGVGVKVLGGLSFYLPVRHESARCRCAQTWKTGPKTKTCAKCQHDAFAHKKVGNENWVCPVAWPEVNAKPKEIPRLAKALKGKTILMHNCLKGATRVMLAEDRPDLKTFKPRHRTVEIQELVRKRLPVLVWSYNHKTKNAEPRRITNWLRDNKKRDWIRVTTELSKQGACYTEDHKLWVDGHGWTEAANLKPKDVLLQADLEPNDNQWQLLLGSLLGDASLGSGSTSRGRNWTVGHKDKHLIAFKANILGRLAGTIQSAHPTKGFSNGNPFYRFTCRTLRSLTNLDKKTNPAALTRHLSWRGLAVWYADDGQRVHQKKYDYPILHTEGFTETQVRDMAACLQITTGLNWRVYKRTQWHVLALRKQDASIFFKHIAPFLPACSAYKIPEGIQNIVATAIWNTEPQTKVFKSKIIRIDHEINRQRKHGTDDSFCIEVKDNHNFFTTTGLVKNCKFDMAVLHNDGLDLTGERILDTMVIWRLISDDEMTYALKRLAKKYLDPKADEPEKELKGWLRKYHGSSNVSYGKIPAQLIVKYVDGDLKYPEGLYNLAMPKIKEYGLEDLLAMEEKVTKSLYAMERRGFPVDREWVEERLEKLTVLVDEANEVCRKRAGKRLSARMKKKTDEATNKAHKIYLDGFDALNVHHVKALYEGLGITSWKRTDKGNQSWDNDVLMSFVRDGDLLAAAILRYRALSKVKETYYENIHTLMGDDNVIHCSIRQAGTKTGRVSCASPNLQNLPLQEKLQETWSAEELAETARTQTEVAKAGKKSISHTADLPFSADQAELDILSEVRGSFIPRPGSGLLLADWDQVELRILANYANEETMIRAFACGIDIHAFTARAAFGEKPSDPAKAKRWRRQGKDLNFGLCLDPKTPILCADYRWRPLEAIKVGDHVLGFDERSNGPGAGRLLKPARVTQIFQRQTQRLKLITDKGNVVCTKEHPWLARYPRGETWRWFEARQLKPGHKIGFFIAPENLPQDIDYKQGYVVGAHCGDGRKTTSGLCIRTKDKEIPERCSTYLKELGYTPALGWEGTRRRVTAPSFQWKPNTTSPSWCAGFLAGFLDTDGYHGANGLRFYNKNPAFLLLIEAALKTLNFSSARYNDNRDATICICLLGGQKEQLRFLSLCRPAVPRKNTLSQRACPAKATILKVIPLEEGPVIDLTTTTSTFIAGGFASHNCYGMGVGLLAIKINVTTIEAKEFKEAYFNRFPRVRAFGKRVYKALERRTIDTCLKHGARDLCPPECARISLRRGWLRSLYGRRRFLGEKNEKLERNSEFYKGLNVLVQGSAGDLMRDTLWTLEEALNTGALLDLVVHDEFIIDTPLDAIEATVKTVVPIMETCPRLTVPLKVSLKWAPERWSQAIKLDCGTCDGLGKTFGLDDDELFDLVYHDKELPKSKVCKECGGRRFLLEKAK